MPPPPARVGAAASRGQCALPLRLLDLDHRGVPPGAGVPNLAARGRQLAVAAASGRGNAPAREGHGGPLEGGPWQKRSTGGGGGGRTSVPGCTRHSGPYAPCYAPPPCNSHALVQATVGVVGRTTCAAVPGVGRPRGVGAGTGVSSLSAASQPSLSAQAYLFAGYSEGVLGGSAGGGGGHRLPPPCMNCGPWAFGTACFFVIRFG